MKKRRTRKKFKRIITPERMLLILLSTLLLFLALMKTQPTYIPSLIKNFTLATTTQLSLEGFTEVKIEAEVVGDYGVVTLTSNCYQITAITEPSQARSIKNGLVGKIEFRPTTHDIMKTIFDEVGIKVLMVKVYDVKNNTFLGKLFLQYDNNVLDLDSRPSDATAIAVRYGAPVYVKNELLKTYGKYIC